MSVHRETLPERPARLPSPLARRRPQPIALVRPPRRRRGVRRGRAASSADGRAPPGRALARPARRLARGLGAARWGGVGPLDPPPPGGGAGQVDRSAHRRRPPARSGTRPGARVEGGDARPGRDQRDGQRSHAGPVGGARGGGAGRSHPGQPMPGRPAPATHARAGPPAVARRVGAPAGRPSDAARPGAVGPDGLHAGLRPEEALALRWADVGATLHVHRAFTHGEQKDTKTGRARSVTVIGPLAVRRARESPRGPFSAPSPLLQGAGEASSPGERQVRAAGFEPATSGSGGQRSIH